MLGSENSLYAPVGSLTVGAVAVAVGPAPEVLAPGAGLSLHAAAATTTSSPKVSYLFIRTGTVSVLGGPANGPDGGVICEAMSVLVVMLRYGGTGISFGSAR